MQIPKQVYDLTPDDLASHPVWEFCLGAEWLEGQDEATVRPRDDVEAAGGWADGDFVVAARFRLRDGTELGGYVFAREEDDTAARQPVIVVERGQVAFWHGAIKPDPNELARAREMLAGPGEQVFPITYRSSVCVGSDFLTGRIRGFCYLDEDEGSAMVR